MKLVDLSALDEPFRRELPQSSRGRRSDRRRSRGGDSCRRGFRAPRATRRTRPPRLRPRSCRRRRRAERERGARRRSAAHGSTRSSPGGPGAARVRRARPSSAAGARGRAARPAGPGGSTFTRAAASSSASGRQSSRRQIPSTCSSATKLGLTIRARSSKSRTASAASSGGTGYCCSEVMCSCARLVAITRTPGATSRSAATLGAASSRCSKLSRSSSAQRSGACRRRSPDAERGPDRRLDEARVGEPSEGTHQTPSSNASTDSAASWSPIGSSRSRPAPTSVEHRTQSEQLEELLELALASDQRSRLDGEVRAVEALRRWEGAVAGLVEPPVCGEVLEPVRTEVAQRRRGIVGEQRSGRLRDQHLTAVTCAHHPRSAMNVEPRVEAVAHDRLARVGPDADPNRSGRPHVVLAQRALALYGGAHRLTGVRESEEERIALHLHLDAAVARERLAK